MKKILIIVLIIALINLIITILLFYKSGVDNGTLGKTDVFPDTVINKVRIDSVQYNINRIDSNIIKYNIYEKDIINKVTNLNDSATVVLFYQLIGKD